MKKRLLSLLLALVMVLSMIPATIFSASAESTYDVYVGGVGMYDGDYLAVGATATQTTKPTGGYAYYKDGVLTLYNYGYTGEGYSYLDDGIARSAIIYASNDIQIELVGTNNLTQKDYFNTACISGKANVSLTGEGTLNLQNSTWGIKGSLNISIESGSLNIDNCKLGIYSFGGKVIINGGNFEVNAIDCAVNGSKGIEINGGSGIFRNTQEDVYSVLHSLNGTVTINPSLTVMASTTADGELGEYVAENHASYEKIVITLPVVYVDVYDIALPEAGVHPDFTFNDEDCRNSSVALVEWFECDKDGKKLSGALPADYKFKEDSYYRLEVTAVPDANYKFDTRNLGFYIGPETVQYYYPYQDTTYPNSVTGWKVYHVDDANGTYTVQIGDITLKDGDYLANNATAVTSTKPSGGYAYYKDGVLTLNNFVAAKLVRYYERYLEVELIGENKIGAIADYYYWDGNASNNYYTGLEFRGDGNLDFDVYSTHPYSNISVNGDVFFNGSGDILLDAEFNCFQYTDNVIINDGYVYCYTSQDSVFGDDTIIEVNGGKLKLFDGGCWDKFLCNGTLTIAAGSVYVNDDPRKIELEDCVPWDGVTDLNTYDCVWIVPKHELYVGGVAMYDGDYLAVGATTTQTTKPSGGYAYYEDGKLTLNNYSYEGDGYEYDSVDDYYAVIYSKNDLTLELIGNNTLTQTEWDSDMIYVDGAKLTVGGNGKLTGTAGGYALYADKDITINGGTVEVSTYFTSIVSHGEVIINDGDITAESEDMAGIYSSYDVTVNGGNVTATGGDRAIDSSCLTVAEGAKIQASTTVDGELGEYVAANLDSYKKIVIKTPDVYVVGDVNADGLVNAKDALLLRKSIAAGNASSLDLKVADVNGDGVVNAKDVVKLRRMVTGGYN